MNQKASVSGTGTINMSYSPNQSSQMNSKPIGGSGLSGFFETIFSVKVLMFAFMAVMFFNLGRSYAQMKAKMDERK